MANEQWPGELGEAIQRIRRQLQGMGLGRIGPIAIVVVLFILVWSSWYTVQPEETAVVQRFGRVLSERTAGPGLHFKIPFGIETATPIPTTRVLKEEFGFRSRTPGRRTRFARGDFTQESLMLTGDLNVIDVQWIVQYRISDPVSYLFKVRRPKDAFRDVSEAVMRRVVGNRLGNDVVGAGRVSVSNEVKEEMQKILNDYETGIKLVTVELQDVTPPDPVKPAYNEVNESRQDKERMINQAQEQRNKIIPKARGEANKAIAEAEGYATERVNRAKGEANRFLAILGEYKQAPEVTRRRLYLEAMSEILPKAKGVYIVDSEQKALVPWLSLDSGQGQGMKPPKEVQKQ